jgi:hypothetical protein
VSEKAIQRILFGVCMLALPVPFLALESGTAPPLRLLFMGSLVGGILVQDPDIMSSLLTALYLGQGLLWSAGLFFATRFVARRLAASALRTPVVCALAIVLIGVSFFPIYRTPFSSAGLHTNILELFD